MSRRRFLVTYDISNDKRRRKVFDLLAGEGDHIQYSVFFCEFNPRELIRAKSQLDDLIHHDEDQILLLDLGPSDRLPDTFLSSIGKAYAPPCPTLVV